MTWIGLVEKILLNDPDKSKLWKLLQKYSGKPWNWSYISMNPNIPIELIEKYPDKPWDWEDISVNPNITMDFIEKYIDKPWNWQWISQNPNLTMDIIVKCPDKPWNWSYISCNDFTYERQQIIEKRLKETCARKIWYDAWLPYWYNPKFAGLGKGFDKDWQAFQNTQESYQNSK